MCVENEKKEIHEIPRKCQGLHVFPGRILPAGDNMKSLNFRDYVKFLVTHIPCNIYISASVMNIFFIDERVLNI